MDYMEKITELRASKAKLNAQAQALVTEGSSRTPINWRTRWRASTSRFSRWSGCWTRAGSTPSPLDGKYDGILHDEGTGKPKDGKKDAVKPFATLGEQLKAVYDLRKGLVADERLEKVNNAAGVTGTNGPDGGFALQEDFAGAILESAVRQSPS